MEADQPIVAVCVVTDLTKCPGNHRVIERTHNGSEEADLWKDGLFGRRVTRYLCVEKAQPVENQDVLVDVAIINERDPVPPGFTVMEYTHDTNEKAIKKRCLCIRWMNPSMTNDAITELIFISKGTRRPPNGYTLIGELNHLAMCYKMGRLQKPAPSQQVTPNLPYQFGQRPPGQTINLTPLGSSLPYAMNPAHQATVNGYPPKSGQDVSSNTSVTPLSGVPWQLNAKFKTQDITIPEIRYKTMMDVENEFAYDFRVERQAMLASESS